MNYNDFLDSWHLVAAYAVYTAMGFMPLIYLGYLGRYMAFATPKEKYDFVSKHEIRIYKILNILVAITFILAINIYDPNRIVYGNQLWFFVRFGVSIVVGVSHIYIAFLILNVYYPKVVGKKLERLRNQPRINPKTGNTMKLLSEEEEDVHLDKGMQAEENIFSVDYDVWIDESSGDTIIEKYAGNLLALVCENCDFQTLRIQREEVIKNEQGQEVLRQYYECSNCERQEERDTLVTATDDDTVAERGKLMLSLADKHVKLQIIGQKDQTTETFDFQSVTQAADFLREYERQHTLQSSEEEEPTA